MSESPHVFAVSAATFEQDVVEASHQRPVLVDFWADWCQPCRMLMPVLERVVADAGGELLLAKVDTDAEQELAMRLGIRSLPTVKLFRDGRVVDEFMGAQSEQQVRRFLAPHLSSPLDELRARARTAFEADDAETALQLLRDAHAEHPQELALALDLATVLLATGQADEAERMLDALAGDVGRDDEVQRLRAQAAFTRRAMAIDDATGLEARHAADPSDDAATHDLATLRIAQGRFEEGLELLLALLRRSRAFRDDAARRDMLAVFALLGGESPLVRDYRRRLASALH